MNVYFATFSTYLGKSDSVRQVSGLIILYAVHPTETICLASSFMFASVSFIDIWLNITFINLISKHNLFGYPVRSTLKCVYALRSSHSSIG